MDEKRFIEILDERLETKVTKILDEKFDENNKMMFEHIDKKFDENNELMYKIIGENNNMLLEQIDNRFKTTIEYIDKKIDDLDGKLSSIITNHEYRISNLEKEVSSL